VEHNANSGSASALARAHGSGRLDIKPAVDRFLQTHSPPLGPRCLKHRRRQFAAGIGHKAFVIRAIQWRKAETGGLAQLLGRT
jgi:hypothetical protein